MTEGRIITEADWIAAVEAHRKRKGWTHARVEDEAGLGEFYYGKLVRGEKTPTLETMAKIQRAMQLELLLVPVL
jgi:transcriptional regulator with XRE-family HTH domain